MLTRKLATERDCRASKEVNEMNSGTDIDLEIALRTFHRLGLEDGDLGNEYWHAVGQLLKRAAGMQAQIDALSRELERCRAMQRNATQRNATQFGLKLKLTLHSGGILWDHSASPRCCHIPSTS
jgi:hypothetical protein